MSNLVAWGRRHSVSAPAFSPGGLPGLTLLLTAGVGCWQDAAGTVPAGNHQLVMRWDDARGASYGYALQATTGAMPVLMIPTTGAPYLYFDGVDDCMFVSNASLESSPELLMTAAMPSYIGGIVAEVYPPSGGDIGPAWFIGNFHCASGFIGIFSGGGGVDSDTLALPLGQVSTIGSFRPATTGVSRFGVGASVDHYTGGVYGDLTGANLSIGSYHNSFNQECNVYEVVVLGNATALDDADWSRYLDYTTAHYGAIQ